MSHDSNASTSHVLYIGRTDSNHDKLWHQLQREGIKVVFARTQKAGLELAKELKPHVVIINTMNGGFMGDRLSRSLGRLLPNVQRLLLTEAGAGEGIPCERRLPRPFTTGKLREAIHQLLAAANPHILRAGDLRLDLNARIVTGPRGEQRLTPKECNLLAYFMRRPNLVFSRRQLMKDVWDTPYMGDTRTLDVHIHWLREKLELDPQAPVLLVTKRGVGYVFVVPEASADADADDDLESA
ncbi:MAG: response regulator transcription factor [Anaerolineae bacterium]|nr:response regulator transcription factor [Anaerolineae bacterium]